MHFLILSILGKYNAPAIDYIPTKNLSNLNWFMFWPRESTVVHDQCGEWSNSFHHLLYIRDYVEKVTRNSKANREKLNLNKQKSIPSTLLFSYHLNSFFTLLRNFFSREEQNRVRRCPCFMVLTAFRDVKSVNVKTQVMFTSLEWRF